MSFKRHQIVTVEDIVQCGYKDTHKRFASLPIYVRKEDILLVFEQPDGKYCVEYILPNIPLHAEIAKPHHLKTEKPISSDIDEDGRL